MFDKFKKKSGLSAPAAEKVSPPAKKDPPPAKKEPTPAKKRAARRCAFVASAEVTELASGTCISARTSEIGIGGCYIETLNPFADASMVHVRIVRDQGEFESKAKVVYSQGNFGMGLAFIEMDQKQRSVLEDWLAELVMQFRPAS